MAFDDAYGSLTDHEDDARWAYGTGFADPMAGVPDEIPAGVDPAGLAAYCLMLGDDALIMSHRLQQWVTRAPELEDEVAIANIALDLLGQARLLLTRAGRAEGCAATGAWSSGRRGGPAPHGRVRDEDDLAYRRDAAEFRNVLLAERADADFAQLVVRLLVFASWRLALFDRLSAAPDPVLAAIAAKGVKELTYHREYAAGWVVRLGDGTEESHRRAQDAVDAVWPLIGELFRPDGTGLGPDPAAARDEFDRVMDQVLTAATLRRPAETDAGGRGRDGEHTAALPGILDELQGLARAVPGGVW
jgi:ring-1,2-phenylacetyl-CoA epoxidase subunit PaaC